MSTIYLVNSRDDLFQALQVYKRLMNLPYDWKIFQKNGAFFLEQQEFLIVDNQEPEKLDSIRIIQHFRSNPETFGIPVLFITEKLSDYARIIYDDLDFVWQLEMPFNSLHFFELVGRIRHFISIQIKLLQQMSECARAIGKHDYSAAKNILDGLPENSRNSIRYYIWTAQVHMGLGDLDRALENAMSARVINQKSLEVSNLLSAIYFKKGDNPKYKEVMEQMTKIAEIHLQNLLHWGDVYLDQGNVARSITAFEAALERDPENQRAKQGILAANLVEGKVNLTGASDLASIESMEIARMFNLKGIAMVESGNFRTAERLYNNAMKILPDKQIAYKLWLNLGLSMKKKGDLQAALAYFERCHQLAPAEYKRAEVQIQFLREEIKKESQAQDFSQIRERLAGEGEKTIDYNKFRKPPKS